MKPFTKPFEGLLPMRGRGAGWSHWEPLAAAAQSSASLGVPGRRSEGQGWVILPQLPE